MELTISEISEKYRNIEDKIPSVWKDYESAAIELAQDIAFVWDITDGEIIRVISLLSMRTNVKLHKHIDNNFGFAGLYPNRIKDLRSELRDDKINEILNEILKKREDRKC
jgi:hypothetical protein